MLWIQSNKSFRNIERKKIKLKNFVGILILYINYNHYLICIIFICVNMNFLDISTNDFIIYSNLILYLCILFYYFLSTSFTVILCKICTNFIYFSLHQSTITKCDYTWVFNLLNRNTFHFLGYYFLFITFSLNQNVVKEEFSKVLYYILWQKYR